VSPPARAPPAPRPRPESAPRDPAARTPLRSVFPRFRAPVRRWAPAFAAVVSNLAVLRESVTLFLDIDGVIEQRVRWLDSGALPVHETYGFAMTLAIEMVKYHIVSTLFIILLSPHRGRSEDRWYRRAVWICWALAVVSAVVTVSGVSPLLRGRDSLTGIARPGLVVLAAALGAIYSSVFLVSWR